MYFQLVETLKAKFFQPRVNLMGQPAPPYLALLLHLLHRLLHIRAVVDGVAQPVVYRTVDGEKIKKHKRESQSLELTNPEIDPLALLSSTVSPSGSGPISLAFRASVEEKKKKSGSQSHS